MIQNNKKHLICTLKIRTFIASPEYCIESTRIQYTQKDLTLIWIHKQQWTKMLYKTTEI